MADVVIPQPPTAQIVTQDVLRQAQYAQWRSASAYGGIKDPSQIWAMMIREDSYAIPLYRELEDKDDAVSGPLDELKLSVLGRVWTIEPGDDSAAAVDAADDLKAQLANLDTDSIFDAMLDAAPYGFSVSELMLDNSAGQCRLVGIDDCPQELFLFGQRFQPQTGPMQMLSSIGAGSGTLVPEEKFLIFSYRGRSRSRVGRPLLQDVFWPSWFKRQILGLWLKAGEKNNGTALARYADGASATEVALALECAEALSEGVAFAAPEGMNIDIDLLKVAKDGNPAIFEKLFDKMELSIARAIKGETLTSFGSEGGNGSRSQGKTHADTFDKRSVSLAKKHMRVVDTQLCRRLTVWNHGPNVATPRFSWDIDEPVDLVQKMTLFQGAQRLGVPIGKRWAAEQLQIPPVAVDDEALVTNVNAATEAVPASVFSEGNGNEAQALSDLQQMDKLAAQLKSESIAKFRTRIHEIAERLTPGDR